MAHAVKLALNSDWKLHNPKVPVLRPRGPDRLEVEAMKAARLATLKFFALLFLWSGFAGLIASAVISTRYLDTMPRWPVPEEYRTVPLGIHGTTVYQTPAENREFNLVENSSVGVFLFGLALGVVYLEKWGSLQARDGGEESEFAHDAG